MEQIAKVYIPYYNSWWSYGFNTNGNKCYINYTWQNIGYSSNCSVEKEDGSVHIGILCQCLEYSRTYSCPTSVGWNKLNNSTCEYREAF